MLLSMNPENFSEGTNRLKALAMTPAVAVMLNACVTVRAATLDEDERIGV